MVSYGSPTLMFTWCCWSAWGSMLGGMLFDWMSLASLTIYMKSIVLQRVAYLQVVVEVCVVQWCEGMMKKNPSSVISPSLERWLCCLLFHFPVQQWGRLEPPPSGCPEQVKVASNEWNNMWVHEVSHSFVLGRCLLSWAICDVGGGCWSRIFFFFQALLLWHIGLW